jgi:hypothetical protein
MICFLREMEWLHPTRAQAYSVAMAVFMIFILVWVPAGLMSGGYTPDGFPFGADYVSFWAASKLILTGTPLDVYLPATHRIAELPILSRHYEAFLYPPTYLVLCTPLAILPFFPSVIAFLSATWVTLLLSTRAILGTMRTAVLLAAFPPVLLNAISGQNGFLTAAILGGGLCILDRRPRIAGIILGLMAIKPHLAIAVPVVLLISRRWLTLFYAGAVALSLMTLATLVFGWEIWPAFFMNSDLARTTLEEGLEHSTMQSTFALARWLGAGIATSYSLQVAVSTVAIGCFVLVRLRNVSGAVERSLIVITSLICSPFLLHYDLVILVFPLIWMVQQWMAEGFPAWSKLVLLTVFGFPAAYLFIGVLPLGAPVLIVFGATLLLSGAKVAYGADRLWVVLGLQNAKTHNLVGCKSRNL